jgi:hypothetical protein
VTAPALARLTSALVIAAGGLTLGHVLNPVVGGRWRAGPLAAFVLALAALGAWRGWREAFVRARWRDERPPPRAAARAAAAGAAAALATAAAGFAVVHGR